MKKLFFALALFAPGLALAQLSYETSPLTHNNSRLTHANSSLNRENSPLNWENSSMNPNSRNGIYSNDGNRIGYAVRNSSGVTNVFTNDGSRIGYIPAPEEEYHPQPFYGSGTPERQQPMNTVTLVDDGFDYPPPRRPPARVKQGFTPLEPPMKSGFTPLQSGFTPLRSGFTPLD